MVTSSGLREFFHSTDKRWDFPAVEDHSPPRGDLGPEQPPRAPKPIRLSILAILGVTAVAVVATALGVGTVFGGQAGTVTEINSATPADPSLTDGASAPREVIVHVSGAVAQEGLVVLPEGARVHDALEKAGGVTPGASLDSINLARVVVDGEHLIVLGPGEPTGLAEGPSTGSISLSLATASQLESLPGIGPALASRIIQWREQNGPFRFVDDVAAVPGIGQATLEGFRDLVVP